MTQQEKKKLLYRKLNALRLEVDGSIVDDIKQTMEVLFAPAAPAQGVEEAIYPNEYVCGFLFDKDIRQVVLIWKEKPAWQKDKLNGVGGKIEPGETPYQAMVREFKEETGLQVENWQPLAEVNGDDWRVHFFFAADDCNQFEYAETKETEEVGKIEVDRLDEFECIPNLYWLIPMAVARIKTPGENIIAGSRWQQEQGDIIKALSGEKVLPTETITTAGELPSQPAPTCCARWVKGEYERLYDLGKSGKRIPSFVDYDWLRDGTRILRDIAVLTPQIMNIGARGICYISPCADENTTEKEDFILKCEQSNVEWLDESPCTCQQELEELRTWKKQATEVMPDFQAIAKELDIPLGQTVHDKILPWIKEMNTWKKVVESNYPQLQSIQEELGVKKGSDILSAIKALKQGMYGKVLIGEHDPVYDDVCSSGKPTCTLDAGWMPGTPKLDKPCVFVSKSGHDYSVLEVINFNTEDGSYLAICDGDGNEWGDISDFRCDSYYMLSPTAFPTREQAEQFSAQLEDDCGFSYKHKEVIGACAITMYDWIIEQINKPS